MRRVLRLKVSAVDICVWKAHGLGHSELFTEIMKDMKLRTSSLSRAIILLVMAAEGTLLSPCAEVGNLFPEVNCSVNDSIS